MNNLDVLRDVYLVRVQSALFAASFSVDKNFVYTDLMFSEKPYEVRIDETNFLSVGKAKTRDRNPAVGGFRFMSREDANKFISLYEEDISYLYETRAEQIVELEDKKLLKICPAIVFANILDNFYKRNISFTNLNIKNILRDRGFYAEQEQISRIMNSIFMFNKYTFNNIFTRSFVAHGEDLSGKIIPSHYRYHSIEREA